jgi:hypothetical protein
MSSGSYLRQQLQIMDDLSDGHFLLVDVHQPGKALATLLTASRFLQQILILTE